MSGHNLREMGIELLCCTQTVNLILPARSVMSQRRKEGYFYTIIQIRSSISTSRTLHLPSHITCEADSIVRICII